MTIPTEVAAVLAEMRELKVPNWPAVRILGDLADRIESALTKAEAVAWEIRGKAGKPWLRCTEEVYQDHVRRVGPEHARALYAHAPPAVPVESPEQFAALRDALWECFRLAGGDTDGRAGPAGWNDASLITSAVDVVRDLRQCYDEVLRDTPPPASVPDGYQLSVSEAGALIAQHEWWIAEADSMGAEYSGNERKIELLRAIVTNQEGAAP